MSSKIKPVDKYPLHQSVMDRAINSKIRMRFTKKTEAHRFRQECYYFRIAHRKAVTQVADISGDTLSLDERTGALAEAGIYDKISISLLESDTGEADLIFSPFPSQVKFIETIEDIDTGEDLSDLLGR